MLKLFMCTLGLFSAATPDSNSLLQSHLDKKATDFAHHCKSRTKYRLNDISTPYSMIYKFEQDHDLPKGLFTNSRCKHLTKKYTQWVMKSKS